jgi:hypothetical protein
LPCTYSNSAALALARLLSGLPGLCGTSSNDNLGDNRPTVELISDVRRGAPLSFQSFEIRIGVLTICGVRNGEEHP